MIYPKIDDEVIALIAYPKNAISAIVAQYAGDGVWVAEDENGIPTQLGVTVISWSPKTKGAK